MPNKKICLVVPSLPGGGAERVMSVLANEFSEKENVEIHLLLFLNNEIYYNLNDKIIIHSPDFNYNKYPVWLYLIKVFFFIRSTLKETKPKSLLSFGGKYNSFVLLSALGLGIDCFISDRSRPGIKYGKFQSVFNPFIYKFAKGIIAQTTLAKEIATKEIGHKNIQVIPNPIYNYLDSNIIKENIVLNVGRFIASKQQELLIDLFIELDPKGWVLWFVGDGNKLQKCKEKVNSLGFAEKIIFWGNQKEVFKFYQKSKIFAFTSISEGFPNVLAEAMSAGCACISFDCMAGPKDLIKHESSGFLIENNKYNTYRDRLKELITNDEMIRDFSKEAIKINRKLNKEAIANQYFEFITNEKGFI